MEFDLLVRKYLRGSLSSKELDRLRYLLEKVPEHRSELRQILELRSMIHDDVLRLLPPLDLSDRTRESVGARFAGLESILHRDASLISTPGELADTTLFSVGQLFAASAEATVGESIVEVAEQPRRRAVILPYRIFGRTLLAASLAIAVALAPTALTPTLDDESSAVAGAGIASVVQGPTVGNGERAISRENMQIAGMQVEPRNNSAVSDTRRLAATRVSSTIDDRSSELSTTAAMIDPVEQTPPVASSIDTDLDHFVIDKDNPLSRIPRRYNNEGLLSTRYNPAADSVQRRQEPPAPLAIAALAVPGLDEESRFMSVGVTLGSGSVIDADAPAALMQNSYYFSFNVSQEDRVGVEMGGSTFMQETQVRGKRPTGNIFAKLGAGDTTSAAAMRAGEGVSQTVAQRTQQDITYGGVFYDRRIEVDKSWDVCVRTTFGAADGALVTGVRAYAAFTPTKNVSLTLGIGGSKLFKLSSGTEDGSTNYGLYYGVETGF